MTRAVAPGSAASRDRFTSPGNAVVTVVRADLTCARPRETARADLTCARPRETVRALLGALAVGATLLTGAAGAASPTAVACGSWPALAAGLWQGFGERPEARGIDRDGSVVVLFVSAAGTWSMVMQAPGKPACIVAAGEGWDPRPAPGA